MPDSAGQKRPGMASVEFLREDDVVLHSGVPTMNVMIARSRTPPDIVQRAGDPSASHRDGLLAIGYLRLSTTDSREGSQGVRAGRPNCVRHDED